MNKRNSVAILTASSVIFSFTLSVSAQTSSPLPSSTPRLNESAKRMMEEARESAKQAMENTREQFKQKMEIQREAMKTAFETEREQLKARLRVIKDERKKQVVERVDKSLDDLNARMTTHYVSVIDKLSDVLTRIDERADKAEEKGVNVASVRTAIESASKAILDARTAVEAQADKAYILTITTEPKLRSDVGKSRQALHADLRVVFEKVKSARNAVHDAARALAKAYGKDLPAISDVSPTPSVSPLPSATPATTPTSTPTPTVTPTTTP